MPIKQYKNKQGKRHQVGGPAWIKYYAISNKEKVIKEKWFKHDQCHRLNGPAVIEYNKGKVIKEVWYINGNEKEGEKQKKAYQTMLNELAHIEGVIKPKENQKRLKNR